MNGSEEKARPVKEVELKARVWYAGMQASASHMSEGSIEALGKPIEGLRSHFWEMKEKKAISGS